MYVDIRRAPRDGPEPEDQMVEGLTRREGHDLPLFTGHLGARDIPQDLDGLRPLVGFNRVSDDVIIIRFVLMNRGCGGRSILDLIIRMLDQ